MPARVLHCYADYKWTGPSEPVATLCREMSRLGWGAELACARPRGADRRLSTEARQMGLTVHDEFFFAGGPNVSRHVRDIGRLRGLIEHGKFDLVHAHGSWDHVLAAMALRGRLRGAPLVRTDHSGREYAGSLSERALFNSSTLGHLIVLSDRLRAAAIDRLNLPPDRVTTVRGAVDLEKYRPIQAPPGIRERFGLSDNDLVFLIVARVQRHRHFDVLLDAAQLVRRAEPRVKIAVLGRGTRKAELFDKPVARLGLRDTVYSLGYHVEDYADILAMADAGLMLVPGSDGSCRAAMEMAATGKPLVVTQRGLLPDIVQDGVSGIVADCTAEPLAEGILEMAQSPERRAEWGSAARRRMEELFNLDKQTQAVLEIYRSLTGE